MSKAIIFEQFNRLKVDRQIKALIGMSRDKFDALVRVFTDSNRLIQQERLHNKEIKRLPSGGPKRILDTTEKQLFFTLYYLKTYPTFDVLGFHFDLSAGHAHDYLVYYLKVLEHSLNKLEKLPKRTFANVDEFRHVIDKYSEIIIDAFDVPCVRPSDNERQRVRYSGKKKRHTLKALSIVNTARRILYLSHLFEGSIHDYAIMSETFDPAQPWFQGTTVRVDLGFLGASKDYGCLSDFRMPHKKPRKSKNNPNPQLTEAQKKQNRAFSKIRVLVEHAIGGMKHFHCLTHRIRNHSIQLIERFFGVSAGLWNLKIS
jgi:hypothetical protein